jgi:Transglycosylase SLT domain
LQGEQADGQRISMKACVRSTLIALALIQGVAAASAGEPAREPDPPSAASGAKISVLPAVKDGRSRFATPLDRVADAVDGAESSHGADLAMWRPDPYGPQGPMQVSSAAATDVGGGDRFDATQNRALGRAYLAQLYWRYKNWPDAIAAYNWGIGNVDAWVKAGRPAGQFLIGVAAYLRRVLHDSGLCDGLAVVPVRQPSARIQPPSRQPRQAAAVEGDVEVDAFSRAACADLDAWGATLDGHDRHLFGATSSRFYSKLDKAMRLALQHVATSPGATHARVERATASWSFAMKRP